MLDVIYYYCIEISYVGICFTESSCIFIFSVLMLFYYRSLIIFTLILLRNFVNSKRKKTIIIKSYILILYQILVYFN